MTLAELVTVMAVGSIVLGLIGTVTVGLMRHDAKNLIRQNRTDGIRQISVWLGDALAYAAPEPPAADGTTSSAAVFEIAEPNEMKFSSALPVAGVPDGGQISQVRLVLGEQCWPVGTPDDPGTLHRCVQSPKQGSDGKWSMCAWGDSACSPDLFDDLVVARGVDTTSDLFSYFVRDAAGSILPGQGTVSGGALGSIAAVEMLVTVVGEDDEDKIQATVFKRFTIREWERM
ncbi:MAG: hypothetical protein LBD97_05710 [Bifidobacteriaceae bacterium]|nr:hypothetical protein [Bifidobacteriaceae bacterium]